MIARRRTLRSLLEGKRSRAGTFLFGFSSFMLLMHWGVVFVFVFRRLGSLSFLRLHYSAGLGVDWIGPWWMIFTFPLFGLVVLVVNMVFARMMAKHDRTLPLIAYGATALTELALAFGGVAATLLNG